MNFNMFIWKLRRRGARVPKARGARFNLYAVLLVIIALLCLILLIQSRMRPQTDRVAAALAHNLAVTAVNAAAAETMEELGVNYDDLIRFEKDADGRVTAMKADMVTANRVKAKILEATLRNIHDLGETDISIPLGGLLSGDLIAGRGPKIPVRCVPVGSGSASFSNEFKEAGINQTLHRVMITVTAEVGVLLPGSDGAQTVETQICVAETVIIGAVPETFASLTPPAGLTA